MLEQLRKEYRNLRNDFEREMELEFAKRAASINARIDAEVWRLHDSGMSVRAICKEYGTKDWATVGDIVRRKPVREATLDVTRGGNGYVIVVQDFTPDLWTHRDHTEDPYTGSFAFEWDGTGLPVPTSAIVGRESGTPLHFELMRGDRTGKVWQAIKEAKA